MLECTVNPTLRFTEARAYFHLPSLLWSLTSFRVFFQLDGDFLELLP